MGEILEIEWHLLIEAFPDQHEYLRAVAEGLDDEPVRPRRESSSIAVSKNFPGKSAIRTTREMRKWVEGLVKELAKRLVVDQVENKRTAENLVYSLLTEEGKPQKTLKIASYLPGSLFELIWTAIRGLNRSNLAGNEDSPWTPPVLNISLSASRFQPGVPTQNRVITEWLGEKKRKKEARMNAVYDENDGREDVIIEEPPPPKPAPPPKSPRTVFDGSHECIVLDSESDEDVAPPPPSPPHRNPFFLNRQPEIEYIQVGGERISRQAFRHLPPDVKKQYEHRIALEEARLLKSKAEAKGSIGRKRAGPIKSPAQQPKKSKPLEAFFKKKN
ncbi:hypothetical protein GCK72_011597 [Caenorhabditis remanei]|uniref:DNA polymerase Y-family little finger domain-containing protein n=1 Tax=Caenorhabditis remanei TaxID=31234 RepID=A0A6A5H936_CAERE|nr:hypothetical protein GCK72_011597 [Caenorhabditis remanei]KAF1763331.1 hypothetical protein GCK72_011597 [Caenorhabditis remanei]